ncbi:putative dsRNA-binding protein [Nonomuraea sp. NPDC059023]|uniref:putative dsRNA-binding protein n=1 Tax=unclassified Nonomuraea TaxID=2593643 RepID=UPI0036A5E77B
MGVVALAEPPIAVPLHKMALLRLAIEQLDRIRISSQLEISKRRFRRILQQMGERHALSDNLGRAAHYFHLAQVVSRQGAASDEVPGWILREIADFIDNGDSRKPRTTIKNRPGRQTPRPPKRFPTSAPNYTPNPYRTPTTPSVQRALIVVDNSDHPTLGDPGSWVDAVPLSEGLIKFLAAHGWDMRENPVRARWLRIATMHKSYLYERERALSAQMNAKLLNALEETGKRWLKLALLDRYLTDHLPESSGAQSTAMNTLSSAADKAVDQQFMSLGAVLFGRGETSESAARPSKSASMAIRQIIGMLALTGGIETVYRIAESAYSRTRSAMEGQRDWRTLLEQYAQRDGLTWKYVEEGPDHNRSFEATVSDLRGRIGKGRGQSKKRAAQAASEVFVRRYFSTALGQAQSQQGGSNKSVPMTYRNPPDRHRQAVYDLRRLFELPHESDAWLSQALTHRSWTYENQQLALSARQRDNALLAHHGSVVFDTLCTHELVQRLVATNLEPNEDEARMGTPGADFCVELFDRLKLNGTVLLGKGQARNPDIAKADVAQAVLAVAWRYLGTSVLEKRPKEVHELLSSYAPIHDGFTMLANMSAVYNIAIDSAFYEEGPDHDRSYAVDLIFTSKSHTFTLECDFYHAGKTRSRIQSAKEVLSLLSSYHQDESELSQIERGLVSFYIKEQIANVERVEQRNLQRCILQGHLGLSYLASGDLDLFKKWAAATSCILGELTTEEQQHLAAFYTKSLAQIQRGSHPITKTQLLSLISWSESLDPEQGHAAPGDFTYTQLKELATSFNSVSVEGEHDLFTVTAALSENHSMPLNIEDGFQGDEVLLRPSEATAISLLVDTAARKSATPATTISLGSAPGGALVLISAQKEGFQGDIGPLAELLAEITPTLTCFLDTNDIVIKVVVQEEWRISEASVIEQAGFAALNASAEGGNLLRELRSHIPPLYDQIAIFESALQASLAADRTNRYRRLLEASEALDAARIHINALKQIASKL